MRYADKVTIVTGGSHGIGAGCVRVFAEAGAKVVFCSRGETEGKALAAEANAKGPGRAEFVRCDVSKEAEVRALVAGAVARHGRLDCLINNAGWHPPHKPIDAFTAQEFRDLLELNLVSMFVACQAALPHLRKTRGNVINLSSLVGSMGQLYATTYVATPRPWRWTRRPTAFARTRSPRGTSGLPCGRRRWTPRRIPRGPGPTAKRPRSSAAWGR